MILETLPTCLCLPLVSCDKGNKFLRVGKEDVDTCFKASEELRHRNVFSAAKIPVLNSKLANWS